jgi:acyl-CoA thioesterase
LQPTVAPTARFSREFLMIHPDDLARAIARAMLGREGTGPAWGVELEDAREGYARAAMTVRADMLNGHGTAHGGMIFALADSAFAYACNSRNQTTVAQHASISFLAPVREGDRLVAEAQERTVEGRSGVYDVTVRVGDRVVAVFQGLSRTVGGAVV